MNTEFYFQSLQISEISEGTLIFYSCTFNSWVVTCDSTYLRLLIILLMYFRPSATWCGEFLGIYLLIRAISTVCYVSYILQRLIYYLFTWFLRSAIIIRDITEFFYLYIVLPTSMYRQSTSNVWKKHAVWEKIFPSLLANASSSSSIQLTNEPSCISLGDLCFCGCKLKTSIMIISKSRKRVSFI